MFCVISSDCLFQFEIVMISVTNALVYVSRLWQLLKNVERKRLVAGGLTVVAIWIIQRNVSRFYRHCRLRRAIAERIRERTEFNRRLKDRLATADEAVANRRQWLTSLKLPQLISELQQGVANAKEVLEAYQWRALAVDETTNCITMFIPDALHWAAELDKQYNGEQKRAKKPPLYGVPVSVKESIRLKGLDCTRGYAQDLFKPSADDAVVIKVLRALGAIPFVQTNIPQSLLWYGCSNPIYGTTTNVHNPLLTCGGSSGGEASLIAGGGSVLGLGSDVGGSIRIPAHFSGIAGLKPSTGSVSTKGSFGSVPGRPMVNGTVGPMAMDVESLAIFMRLMTGTELMRQLDPYIPAMSWREELYKEKRSLRIGYYTYDEVLQAVPACVRAVELAKETLERNGHTLVQFQPPNTAEMLELFAASASMDGGIYLYRMLQKDIVDKYYAPMVRLYGVPLCLKLLLGYLLRKTEPVLTLFLRSLARSPSELRAVYERINNARDKYADAWNALQLDAVLCPALACVAVPHHISSKLFAAASYTVVFNLLDYTSGVVPVTEVLPQDEQAIRDGGYRPTERFSKLISKHNVDGTMGLPVGVQCVTPPHMAERCLRIMREIQDARGTT